MLAVFGKQRREELAALSPRKRKVVEQSPEDEVGAASLGERQLRVGAVSRLGAAP